MDEVLLNTKHLQIELIIPEVPGIFTFREMETGTVGARGRGGGNYEIII